MELPIHKSITQSDGQLDDDFVLGDGFGGDGEYGGAGLGGLGWGVEEEEEPEWVRDEIPFGRRAREAGVRFVGGKGDGASKFGLKMETRFADCLFFPMSRYQRSRRDHLKCPRTYGRTSSPSIGVPSHTLFVFVGN